MLTMTNPAVAKWLEEIASAKAKAQSKASQVSNPNINTTDGGSKLASTGTLSTDPPKGATTPSASPYGIFPSFNLKTRKKQLRLVLPPPPPKPGPGECCGNDCNPCINTLYQEDLADYQERIRNLKAEYEQACLDLELGKEQDSSLPVPPPSTSSTIALEDEDRKAGLSLRSYRPFKILQKEYLNETTLLVVCDAPMPSPRKTPLGGILPTMNTMDQRDDSLDNMFHVLIRFRSGPDDYLTKAFTPVNFSSLQDGNDRREDLKDKLTFLIKLYPSPHLTSDMFRGLQIGPVDNEKSALYLRGPIHTSRTPCKDTFVDRIPPTEASKEPRTRNYRIVMIAAGSGITPMYQLLQHLHGDEIQTDGHGNFSQEVDLIYCNRTKNDIWLRQELETIACQKTREGKVGSWKQRKVRIQHVLSSSLSDRQTLKPARGQETMKENEEERFHSGRITLGLLRDTLQHSLQKDPVQAEDPILQILICGPPSFNTDVSAMLLQLGYSSSSSSSSPSSNRCEIHILE